MSASNLRINGQPATIQQLEHRRADGRPMVKPVFSPGRGCIVDAGWLPPATPAKAPAPPRRPKPAAAANGEPLSTKLRRIATAMLAEVEPVYLRDLAREAGVAPKGIGPACRHARITTRRTEAGAILVAVLP